MHASVFEAAPFQEFASRKYKELLSSSQSVEHLRAAKRSLSELSVSEERVITSSSQKKKQ